MTSYSFRLATTAVVLCLWLASPSYSEDRGKPAEQSKTRVATYSLKRVLDHDIQAALKAIADGKGSGTREEWLELLQDSASFEMQVFDAVIFEEGEPSGRIKEFVGDNKPDIRLVTRKEGETPNRGKVAPPELLRTKEFEVKILGRGVENHRDSNEKIVSKEFVVDIHWEAKDGKGLSLGNGVEGTGYGFQSVLQIGKTRNEKK